MKVSRDGLGGGAHVGEVLEVSAAGQQLGVVGLGGRELVARAEPGSGDRDVGVEGDDGAFRLGERDNFVGLLGPGFTDGPFDQLLLHDGRNQPF